MSHNENNVDFVNGNVQDIATAYYNRDVQMNIDFNSAKDFSLAKLGYTQEMIQKSIQIRFSRHVNDIVVQYHQNVQFNNGQIELANINNMPNMFNISIHQMFENFRNSDMIRNLVNQRMNRMNVLYNINNHQEFYNQMTLAELGYIGF